MLKRYQARGDAGRDVRFVGQLAACRCRDMHRIAARSLSGFERVRQNGLPGATGRSAA